MGFDLRAGERLTSAWRGHCRLPDVWRVLGANHFVLSILRVCVCEREETFVHKKGLGGGPKRPRMLAKRRREFI